MVTCLSWAFGLDATLVFLPADDLKVSGLMSRFSCADNEVVVREELDSIFHGGESVVVIDIAGEVIDVRCTAESC